MVWSETWWPGDIRSGLRFNHLLPASNSSRAASRHLCCPLLGLWSRCLPGRRLPAPPPECRKLVVDETGQTTRLSLYRISGGLTEFLFLPHRLNGLRSTSLPVGATISRFLAPTSGTCERRPGGLLVWTTRGGESFRESQLLRFERARLLSGTVRAGGHIY